MANTLKFKTEVDASGFFAGIKKVENEAKSAGSSVKDSSKSAANAVKSEASGAADKVGSESKKAEQQAKNAASSASSKVKSDVKSAGSTVEKAADSASSSIKKGASSAGNKVKSESASASSKAKSEMQSVQSVSENVFKKIGAAIAAAFSVQVLINFGQELVQELNTASKAWQSFEGNMKILGKSSGEIKKVRKELSQYAADTIYDASDMASTYSQLAAVGVKSADKLVTGFGGIAASAEDPKQAMKTISEQATQMAGKPTVAWQDFKLMFEQAPSGIAAVARTMGESTSQLVQDVQAGKVSTEDFFKAIEKTGNTTGKKGFKTMAQSYKTVGEAFDGLKETLVVKLQPAFDKVSKVAIKGIEGIINALGKANSPLSQAMPVLKMFGAAVAAAFSTLVVVKFVSMVQKGFSMLSGLLSANPYMLIAAAIAAVVVGLIELYKRNKRFQAFMNQMFGELRTAFTPLINLIKQGISSLTNFIKQHASTFKAIGDGLLKALMVTINIIVQIVKIAVAIITGIIKAVIVVIQTVIKVVKAVGRAFKTVFGAIGGIVKKGAGLVVKGFKTIIKGAKKVGDLPKKFLNWGKDMMANMKKGIEAGWKKVKGSLGKVLGWIKDHFHFSTPDEGPLSDFDTWAPDAMQTMAQGIEDNLPVVQAPLEKLGTTIKSGLQDAMATPATPATPKAAAPATTSAQPAQSSVTQAAASVTTQAPAMATASNAAFQPIETAANQKTTQALTDTQKNLIATRTFIASQGAPFQAASYNLFNQVATASQNRMQATEQQSANTVQNIRGYMIAQTSPFKTTSYDLFMQVYTSGQNRMNATQSLTQGIINQIVSWMRNQYGAFYSAGHYTMEGFKNGMEAERQAIVNTSNSLVKAVKDAFVKGLGIHSPATWMTWAGRNTGLGFVKGFNAIDLGKLARSKVNDMKGAFSKARFDAGINVDYMGDDSLKEVSWMRKFDGGSVVNGTDGGKGGRFVNNMLKLVNDDSHGYSQANRWGPDYDCSSSIITALRWAGFDTGNASYTGNMSSELTKHGWERLPYGNPKRGDILLNDATHVEMSLGNGKNAGFHSAHGHPETGDQAHEAYVGRDPGGWAAILRYKNGFGDSLADAIEEAYNFKKFGYGSMDEEGDAGAPASGSLADWTKQALQLTGQPMSLLKGLMRAAKAESGGNPRAVNNWDINAKLGHPSKGLMQTIDSTFRANAVPGHTNIWNPVDNMAAAIRYMIKRYGSVEAVLKPRAKHWYGYAVGSRYIDEDQVAELHKGEAVIRASENPYRNSKGGFMTPLLEKVVANEMNAIANRTSSGIRTIEARGVSSQDMNFTQVVNFKETPKQPSEFRAALRMEGRLLAFGR